MEINKARVQFTSSNNNADIQWHTNKVKNFFHIILRFYITFNYLGTYRQMHTSLKSPVSLSLVTKFIIAVKNLLNEEITAPQFNALELLPFFICS